MALPNVPALATFKQTNDWNCGVYALRYLLYLKHFDNLAPTEKDLGTTPEIGTPPQGIIAYLTKQLIPTVEHIGTSLEVLTIPCLLNYQWQRDGHFGVLIERDKKSIWIFNPGNAKYDRYNMNNFLPRWYSIRNHRHWALVIADSFD